MPRKPEIRARGRRATLLVLTILVLTGAGGSAVLKWPNAGVWIAVIAGSTVTLLASVTPLYLRWRDQRFSDKNTIRRSIISAYERHADKLPTVADADLGLLRVHPPVVQIAYVPRASKETEIADLLKARLPVLIVGSSMVGKTRLAAEVAKLSYPGYPLLIPDAPAGLFELDKADISVRNHVIWLDDIDRFFASNGLTVGLIRRLAVENIILATLRVREWDRYQPTDLVRPPEWEVIGLFKRVTLSGERDRPVENDLCRIVPDVEVRRRIQKIGVGEYVGAAHLIKDRIALGAETNPLGYGLLLGAADWRNAGITRGIPEDLLPKLASARLNSRQRAAIEVAENYAGALQWATREINPTVALLNYSDDSTFVVYDYALDTLADTSDIPADTWRLVIEHATADELVTIGVRALGTYKLLHVAEAAWRKAASAGKMDAINNLAGVLLEQGHHAEAEDLWRQAAEVGLHVAMTNFMGLMSRSSRVDDQVVIETWWHEHVKHGDQAEAEFWWREGAEAGDQMMMFYLGVLLGQRGDYVEAEGWLSKAVEAGVPAALHNLGESRRHQGDQAGAVTWWRKAAENGITESMFSLGLLLTERGDHAEAESWWRKAAEAGHLRAMYNVGVVLRERGVSTEAETWWRKATEAGSNDAMCGLGVLHEERGDESEAERWYLKAANAGSRDATIRLGSIYEKRGNLEEAQALYLEAAEGGHPAAMHRLGWLLNGQGHRVGAETWFRKAAEAGHPVAMFDLGVASRKRRDLAEAETWFRRAADAAYPQAPFALAVVYEQLGNQAEAMTWYSQAADAGDAAAMHRLGLMLRVQGNQVQADACNRKAAEAGNPEAMYSFGAMLEEQGNRAEAIRWYSKAADTGHTASMTILGVLLANWGANHEAEAWWRKAAEAGDPDAMYNLGIFLAQRGDQPQAEVWQRKAGEVQRRS